MGDCNAKVDNERIDRIVGSFGFGEINDQGEKLVDWCIEYNFVVINTLLETTQGDAGNGKALGIGQEIKLTIF